MLKNLLILSLFVSILLVCKSQNDTWIDDGKVSYLAGCRFKTLKRAGYIKNSKGDTRTACFDKCSATKVPLCTHFEWIGKTQKANSSCWLFKWNVTKNDTRRIKNKEHYCGIMNQNKTIQLQF